MKFQSFKQVNICLLAQMILVIFLDKPYYNIKPCDLKKVARVFLATLKHNSTDI